MAGNPPGASCAGNQQLAPPQDKTEFHRAVRGIVKDLKPGGAE